MADGSLIFDTKVDTSGFQRGAGSLKQQAVSVQNIFKKVGGTIAAAFTIKEIISFGKEAINLASDLQEVQNVVDTAFGSMAHKMEEFADTCIEMYGMSKLTAKQMGSTFMAMAKGMGQSTDIASDKAIELTGRLGDIMSFYNKTADEVNTIGKAIYSGETEPLKAIGIIMTQTNLEAYALAEGYEKLYSEMSAEEKLLVRQNYFLKQTEMAAGDFEKTQASWANQTRILSEQWKEFMTLLGNAAIQVLTPVVQTLNTLVGALVDVGTELSKIFGITAASNISEEAATAQTELENLGDTIEETQEKGSGGTASFDKLEVVSGGETETTEASAIEDKVEAIKEEKEATVETEEATSELEEAIYRTGEALQWLGNTFETSFMDNFGDTGRFDSIIDSFRRLKESISGIFSSPDLQGAAGGFFESIITRIGAAAGSFASIGTSIIDNLLGGASLSLSENEEGIKNSLVNLFKIGERWNEINTEYTNAVASIATVFESDEAKGITSSLFSLFTTATLGILEGLGTFATDVLDLLTAPFIENKEKITQTIQDTFAEIQPILETLQGIVDNVFSTIRQVYDEKVAPLIQKLKEGFVEIGEELLDAYNKYILPVITYASEKFQELADGPIGDLIDKFGEFARKVCDAVGAIWDGALKPFIKWFIRVIAPIIGKQLKQVIDFFSKMAESIAEGIGWVLDILGGLLDFITTGFTEGWGTAWENLKTAAVDIFEELWDKLKGIINSILGGVESMANGVVGGINKMIDALNGLSFDIPDWVPKFGGESFGFSIPKIKEVSIPKLATGTVVPANYGEFAAILGDNKREAEVVSPLSTIEKAMENVMARMQAMGGDITLIAQLDGEVIYKEVVKRDRIQKKRTGKSALA
ncbi:MAG: hypothetical protein IJ420_06240 [Lachnospiraceae bacterium]|nr:hypothetical protein [Lachnospiraceae bacterium]